MQAWLQVSPGTDQPINGQVYGYDLLPAINPALGYLVALLHDMGTVISTGMGVSALPWQEIKAYAELTGSALTGFEARAVQRMSQAVARIIARPDVACPVDDELVHERMNEINLASWIAVATKAGSD